jgi:Adenosyl cobinamide kinase/adenosyl cobinamide phosphate guanylyltransferase
MDLIIGGAYQGKLTYARARYGLSDGDIFECGADGEPDVSRRCVCHLEEYVLSCVRRGVEPACAFRPDAVLICRDVSCGIVPMDAECREWREAVGRFLNRLSAQAEHVTRVFCGLPLALK